MYCDQSAVLIETKAEDSVKVYKDTYVRESTLGGFVTVGDGSRIVKSSLDSHVIIQRRNLITDSSLGRYTSTMHDTSIFRSEIGAFCSLSWSVSIGGAAHDYENATTHGFTSFRDYGIIEDESQGLDLYADPVVIGNDVWIATGACINRGVTIGDGAVIGANAVVTRDVEPYTIVAGCPARPIKKRFCEDWIRRLLNCRWWDLPEEDLKAHVSLFSGKLDEERLRGIEELCRALGRA